MNEKTRQSQGGPEIQAGPTMEQLFEKAVRENSRRLLGIARGIVGNRVSPEDVVQQAVMNLYQHRARYDWRQPGGLLRRAVVNEALRILRQPRMAAMEEDFHEGSSEAPVCANRRDAGCEHSAGQDLDFPGPAAIGGDAQGFRPGENLGRKLSTSNTRIMAL